MLELHAPEVLLELAYLFKVGHHVGVLRSVALVGEVDEELGVAFDEDALDAEGDGSFEPGDEAFVLGYVVGDLVAVLEAELDGVVEPTAGGKEEGISSKENMTSLHMIV